MKWPDPILKNICIPVENLEAILPLIADMEDTLVSLKGAAIGLSAPQVGQNLRLFTLNVGKLYTVINPEIIKEDSSSLLLNEGCLSFPNLSVMIKRPKKVKARFMDSKGKVHTLNFSHLEARCFLHEMDHLNGIVFTERV